MLAKSPRLSLLWERRKPRSLFSGLPSTLGITATLAIALALSACRPSPEEQAKTLGTLVAQPPLNRLQAGIPTFKAGGRIEHIAFAANAGVAAALHDGTVTVIDTRDGQALATFATKARGPLALSPNGRVLAIGDGNRLALHDTEGHALGTIEGAEQGRAWWVADDSLAFNNANDHGLRVKGLILGREGALDGVRNVQAVMPQDDSSGRMLVLGDSTAALIAVQKGAPLSAGTAEIWDLPQFSTLEHERMVSYNGLIYGIRDDNLIQIGIDGGTRVWPLTGLPVHGLQPTPDPDKLLLTLSNDTRSEVLVYSIRDATLSAIAPPLSPGARLVYEPGLRRNVLIDGDTVRVLGSLQTGSPEFVGTVAARFGAAAPQQ